MKRSELKERGVVPNTEQLDTLHVCACGKCEFVCRMGCVCAGRGLASHPAQFKT